MALVDVIDKQSTGRIIIPPFITNTIQSSDVTNANRDVSPFKACDSLVKLDLSNFNMGNKMVDIDEMFSWCTSLEFIDIRNFNYESIGKYKNTMFYKCDSLKVLKQPESLSKKNR